MTPAVSAMVILAIELPVLLLVLLPILLSFLMPILLPILLPTGPACFQHVAFLLWIFLL